MEKVVLKEPYCGQFLVNIMTLPVSQGTLLCGDQKLSHKGCHLNSLASMFSLPSNVRLTAVVWAMAP